jgi:hypothetical protein
VRSRSRILFASFLVLAAIGVVAVLKLVRPGATSEPREPAADLQSDLLPSLEAVSGWLNGSPDALDSLSGHPVLLALWSDTDPRCLDALQRVESWHQAYSRYGARVIGVYAPEYSFGIDSMVPARIARRLGLTFPIAMDPSYHVRPRIGRVAGGTGVLLADDSGQVVLSVDLDHLDEVDRALRRELRRSHPDLDFPAEPEPTAHAAPAREIRFVHLGAGRAGGGPLADVSPGHVVTFTTQFRYQEEGKDYVPYPVGRWMPTAEGLVADRGGAADFVAIRHPGDRMWAVLSPRETGSSRVWILADDGWMPARERGEDVRADDRGATYVEVTEPRLYGITRPGKARVLRFSPQDPGLTIHAFAFERAPSARP